jgi:hypothetical protein
LADRVTRWASIVLGVLMAMLALPQLAAALMGLPADPVLFALRAGKPVSDEALRVLEHSRAAIVGWYPNALAYRERSGAALLRAGRAAAAGDPGAGEQRALAGTAARAALARAPVDPQGWATLARLAWDGDGNPDRTRDLLRASFATGGYQPGLTAARVRLTLVLWPTLGPEDRALFGREIRHLWRDEPDSVARFALEGEDLLVIAGVLDDDAALRDLLRRRQALLGGQRP